MSDVLYHGTSSAAWEQIRLCGEVRPYPSGHPHVSLTRNPEVARYFAELAVGMAEGSEPVILAVSRGDLDEEGVAVSPFSDQTKPPQAPSNPPDWWGSPTGWRLSQLPSGSGRIF